MTHTVRLYCAALVLVVTESLAATAGGAFHVLPAADYLNVAAADRPFDLAGSSLVFTPAGAGYRLTRTALQYDSNRGQRLELFTQGGPEGWQYARYSASSFSFPFDGASRSEIYVYVWGGVFFAPPPQMTGAPNRVMLAARVRQAGIAPFLLGATIGTFTPSSEVLVRESSEALLLTWTSDAYGPAVAAEYESRGLSYDVQLLLRRDGTIVFSYRTTSGITWPLVGLWSDRDFAALPDPLALQLQDDLSALAGDGAVHALPIVESFSVPSIDEAKVWADLKRRFGYRDDEIDGVAIYEDFYTAMVFWAAASCQGGNPGVDGLMRTGGSGSNVTAPRYPAILEMSNVAQDGGYGLLLHEFAHRWLYAFSYLEDGLIKSYDSHPGNYTDTTAAFPTSAADHSPLGGHAWIDRGDGTFVTRLGTFEPGYSWHELYFLGLAAPEEVPPWFYIAEPQVVSMGADLTETVRGVRKPLTIQSVVAANGSRVPGAATSQKHFAIVLVLLARDPAGVSPRATAMLIATREGAAQRFGQATGSRATLRFLPEPAVRHRATRH